jgi:hypothetical protein
MCEVAGHLEGVEQGVLDHRGLTRIGDRQARSAWSRLLSRVFGLRVGWGGVVCLVQFYIDHEFGSGRNLFSMIPTRRAGAITRRNPLLSLPDQVYALPLGDTRPMPQANAGFFLQVWMTKCSLTRFSTRWLPELHRSAVRTGIFRILGARLQS